MATTFYKLKEGDKFYRIDIKYDDEENITGYVRHDYVMARDASIENYNVRFMCYDMTNEGKNTMFVADVRALDNYKRFNDDETDLYVRYLTVSKKKCDAECERLDAMINEQNIEESSSDGEEG